MSDLTSRLKKHIAERRLVIHDRYRKRLSVEDYHFNCGQEQELLAFEGLLQESIRKMNAAEEDIEEILE